MAATWPTTMWPGDRQPAPDAPAPVPAPVAAPAPAPVRPDLRAMKRPDLLREARAAGIRTPGRTRNADLVLAILRAWDE